MHRRRLRQLHGHLLPRGERAAAADGAAADDEPSVGLLLHSTPQASAGLTLFTKGRSSLLIDNEGQLVHEWKSNRQSSVAYLRDNGNLVRLGQSPRWNGPGAPRDETAWNDKWSFAGGSGYIQELAWDGTLLWEYAHASYEHLSHHDCEVRPPFPHPRSSKNWGQQLSELKRRCRSCRTATSC